MIFLSPCCPGRWRVRLVLGTHRRLAFGNEVYGSRAHRAVAGPASRKSQTTRFDPREMNEQSRESLKEDRNFGSATRSDFCRAVARSVCSPLTIVEPGSHPPNVSISFHLVNSPKDESWRYSLTAVVFRSLPPHAGRHGPVA